MFLLNGNVLKPGNSFTDASGRQYPPSWLYRATAEDLARAGIAIIPDPEPFDPRFYCGRDGNGDLIPRPVEEVQENMTRDIKTQAADALSTTDWKMIRALERALYASLSEEDKALADEREAVRVASNEAEAAVVAVQQLEVLAETKVDLKAMSEAAPVIRG